MVNLTKEVIFNLLSKMSVDLAALRESGSWFHSVGAAL